MPDLGALGEPEAAEPREHPLDRDLALEAGERRADARVHAGPEGQMSGGVATVGLEALGLRRSGRRRDSRQRTRSGT